MLKCFHQFCDWKDLDSFGILQWSEQKNNTGRGKKEEEVEAKKKKKGKKRNGVYAKSGLINLFFPNAAAG